MMSVHSLKIKILTQLSYNVTG